MKCHMIRMMYGVRPIHKVLIDFLCDRVGVVVKINEMIMQSHLQWYGHAICQVINYQIREVLEIEITVEEGSTKEIVGRVRK